MESDDDKLKMRQSSVLIPRLTDDVAIECLIRVPYNSHSEMGFLCKSWKALFSSRSFHKERRRLCFSKHLLCFVHSLISTNRIDPKNSLNHDQKLSVDDELAKTSSSSSPLSYGLSVYNASNQTWQRVLGRRKVDQFQVPMFCHCVALPDLDKIVIVGGWDTQTLEPVASVYVFDLVTRRSRLGAYMKKARSFFACAAFGRSRVYVAGGHDY